MLFHHLHQPLDIEIHSLALDDLFKPPDRVRSLDPRVVLAPEVRPTAAARAAPRRIASAEVAVPVGVTVGDGPDLVARVAWVGRWDKHDFEARAFQLDEQLRRHEFDALSRHRITPPET
jgi:hypothetical protein